MGQDSAQNRLRWPGPSRGCQLAPTKKESAHPPCTLTSAAGSYFVRLGSILSQTGAHDAQPGVLGSETKASSASIAVTENQAMCDGNFSLGVAGTEAMMAAVVRPIEMAANIFQYLLCDAFSAWPR